MDQISIANLITQHFILNFDKIFGFQAVRTSSITSYQSEKLTIKLVNNAPAIGLWRSFTCQNSHADISPLILMTDLIDIYALLPENISFLECFWQPRIYFTRFCNNPMEITQNHFCGVFSQNHKYLREIFLRCLRDVTEIASFLRYARDVLKTLHKRHLLWDVFETS